MLSPAFIRCVVSISFLVHIFFPKAQALPLNIKQTAQGQLSFHWQVESPQLDEVSKQKLGWAQQMKELKLDGYSLTSEEGLPALPYHSFIVVGSAKEIQAQISIQEEKRWPDIQVLPAPKWPCRCEDQEGPVYRFDQRRYRSQDDKSWLEVHDLGDYKGVPLSKVILRPVLQDQKGLRVLKSAEVELKGARTFNLETLYEEKNGAGRFLIITHEEDRSLLKPFVDLKKEQGHQIVWLIYQSESFNELREKIRAINDEGQIDYALIVGSEDDIPTEYVKTSADPRTPSDLNYFNFGQAPDYIPDVFYSRLVARSARHLSKIVEKIVLSQERGSDYPVNEILAIASNEGYNPTDVEYVQEMVSPLEELLGWRTRFYFEGERDAQAHQIVDGFNKGALWLNYIGHGVGDAWTSVTGRDFDVDDVEDIRAHSVLPTVIDVACQNGKYSLDSRLGVHLMNHSRDDFPAGAVAFYGGTVDISWHPPAVMAVGIGEARASGLGKTLGEILWAGQLHLLESYDDLPSAIENLAWYQLQGDPSALMER